MSCQAQHCSPFAASPSKTAIIYNNAASFVLCSVSKYSAGLTQCVVDADTLQSLVECLS